MGFRRAAAHLSVLVAAIVPTTASAASPPPHVLRLDPDQMPPAGTTEISQYGGHLTWVQAVNDGTGATPLVVLDRSRGRTRALPIAPVRDLDLGPGPGGRTTAVYVRCSPSCNVWRYDFPSRDERRVRSVSAAGISEHNPSVWGSRIAFSRDRKLLLGDLHRRGSHRLERLRASPSDIELGKRRVAYVERLAGREGNGQVVLRLRRTASGRERTLARGVIGEASSTGYGGLTFGGPRLYWQSRRRHGCRVSSPTFAEYHIGHGRIDNLSRASTPSATRLVAVTPPQTPEAENCEQGLIED